MKKKLYLLLTRFPDRGTKWIRLFRNGYYPHASIGLEEDLNTFYSFVFKGFIVEKITRYVKPEQEPFPCQLYTLEVPEAVYRRVKDTLEYFVLAKEILHYTKTGLVLSLLRIPYKRPTFGFFCTQFVAELLHQCGAVTLKRRSTRYFAEDLRKLPGMKLHFQGNMAQMIRRFDLAESLV